jgi:hypothetical protein
MKTVVRIPGRGISSNKRLQPVIDFKTGKPKMISRTSKQGRKREIEAILMMYRGQLRQLGEAFNPKTDFFLTTYRFVYPKADFWTKKKTMSTKLLDTDNGMKTIKDMLFEWIGHNDRFSRKELVEASPGFGEYVEISIEIRKWEDDIAPELLPWN